MKRSDDLNQKLHQFPKELVHVAKLLLNEIESGKKSNAAIEDLIRDEIREVVLEEETE
jgi:hypothetical protein